MSPESGTAVTHAYSRLADALRRGAYPRGTRLPGERDLATQLGISRSTLRLALGRLEQERQLDRSSQRGWFVPQEVVGEPPSVLQSFTEMARARGLRPTAHVLSARRRGATFEEADRLKVAPSADVLELRRVRSMDDVPICLDTTVLVGARVEPMLGVDLEDRSLYLVLEEMCGVVLARSSYSLQAGAAGREAARLLAIDEGAPVLMGQEVTYDTDEVPVLVSDTTYRGDAYRFQADLYRPVG